MFRKLHVTAFIACAVTGSPALAQTEVCPASANGHVITQLEYGDNLTIQHICEDEKLEVLESAKASPLRKGIGTDSPAATLDINGGVKIGHDKDECTGEKAGTIRWTGTAFEGCDGSQWIQF